MANIRVVEGDITKTPADVLLAVANPSGDWSGGIDHAIRRNWGNDFHAQLRGIWEKKGFAATGDTVLTQSGGHKVMFVCDDLDNLLPLSTVLYPGLDAIASAGMTKVVMPVVRTGGVAWFLGVEVEDTERELVSVLKAYSKPLEITLVVYNDSDQADRLRALIAS